MAAPSDYTNAKSAEGPATTVNTENGAENIFVCPLVADLDISGNASITTLQQVTVSIAYDDRYDIELTGNSASASSAARIAGATAKDLTSAFVLDGSGSTFAVDLANGGAQLADVLQHVIENAKRADEVGGSDKTLDQRLGADMLRVFKDIFADALPNILQSDYTLVHEVKSAEGAADMQDKLEASPAAREIIAQQLPESNYEAYMDGSENHVGTDLPLVNGDTLVFIFNVNLNLVVRDEKKTAGTTADNLSGVSESGAPAGAGSAGTGPYSSPTQKVTYIYESRKVAFFVKVAGLVPKA